MTISSFVPLLLGLRARSSVAVYVFSGYNPSPGSVNILSVLAKKRVHEKVINQNMGVFAHGNVL